MYLYPSGLAFKVNFKLDLRTTSTKRNTFTLSVLGHPSQSNLLVGPLTFTGGDGSLRNLKSTSATCDKQEQSLSQQPLQACSKVLMLLLLLLLMVTISLWTKATRITLPSSFASARVKFEPDPPPCRSSPTGTMTLGITATT